MINKQTIAILLFFCTITILLSCKSSYTRIGDKNANYIPYYLKVYEADSLFLVNDFDGSYKILDSLFKKYEPINMTLYFEYENYIKSSVLLSKKRDYTKNIKRLVRDLGYNFDELKNDSLLKIAFQNSNLTKEKVLKLHISYVKNIDTIFRKKINIINAEDQEIRNRVNVNKNEIKKIGQKHDSVIQDYFAQNGYPSDKKIGTFRKLYANESSESIDIGVILNHLSNTESYVFYYEHLIKYVKNGTCPPINFAHMVDRHYNHLFNKTFYYFIPNNHDIYLKDKILTKEINIRRKLSGLPSLEYEKFWYEKVILNY